MQCAAATAPARADKHARPTRRVYTRQHTVRQARQVMRPLQSEVKGQKTEIKTS